MKLFVCSLFFSVSVDALRFVAPPSDNIEWAPRDVLVVTTISDRYARCGEELLRTLKEGGHYSGDILVIAPEGSNHESRAIQVARHYGAIIKVVEEDEAKWLDGLIDQKGIDPASYNKMFLLTDDDNTPIRHYRWIVYVDADSSFQGDLKKIMDSAISHPRFKGVMFEENPESRKASSYDVEFDVSKLPEDKRKTFFERVPNKPAIQTNMENSGRGTSSFMIFDTRALPPGQEMQTKIEDFMQYSAAFEFNDMSLLTAMFQDALTLPIDDTWDHDDTCRADQSPLKFNVKS